MSINIKEMIVSNKSVNDKVEEVEELNIKVGDMEDYLTNQNIKKVSSEEGNLIETKDDGIFVPIIIPTGVPYVDDSEVTEEVTKTSKAITTSDKPIDKYTGTGSTDIVTIETGGTGSAILINSSLYSVLVTPVGGMVMPYSGGNVTCLGYESCHFINGVLTISTDNVVINSIDTEYEYQVL